MKKIIWVCGVIAGIISVSWGVIGMTDVANGMSIPMRIIFGYIAMLLGFSLIFVGVKNYRDNYNEGIISFGKAFKIGLLITLVASTLYVIIWMIVYTYFMPNFTGKYEAQALAELKAAGASAEEIKRKAAEMSASMQQYDSSFIFRAISTYLEIAPVGIIVSLIAALILKNKTKLNTINA